MRCLGGPIVLHAEIKSVGVALGVPGSLAWAGCNEVSWNTVFHRGIVL